MNKSKLFKFWGDFVKWNYNTVLAVIYIFHLTTGVLSQDDASGNDDFRVICVYGSWAFYRTGMDHYTPDNLDPSLCTDILYDRAELNEEANALIPGHNRVDVDEGYYEKVVGLKKEYPHLRVHVLVGGWDNSKGNKYSKLVSDPGSRESFVRSVVDFLDTYEFDGLNVAWMFPTCWQAVCEDGPSSDKENFIALMKELREAMMQAAPNKELSVTVSPNRTVAMTAYDIPELESTVDMVNLMTYDMAGPWDKKTAHHAPLYLPAGIDAVPWSVSDAVKFWMDSGVPSKKIIMGIPTYGVGFTISPDEAGNYEVGVRTIGPSTASSIFKEERMAYYEICAKVKEQGWTKVDNGDMGPFAYEGDQWVGYDDVNSVIRKANFVKENQLGGVAIWETSMDDFNALCCQVKNPLTNAISFTLLEKGQDPADNIEGCERASEK